MSMCWSERFSARRSLQFRECTFFASSVLSGSANAFLTLRVGMITKEYCRCTVEVEKKGLRRAATLKAAQLLGSIVKEGTVELSKAAVDATKSKVTRAFQVVTGRRGKAKTS